MITETGTIKTSTQVNEKVMRQFCKKFKNNSVISLVAGSIGLAVYLVMSIVLDILYEISPGWLWILLVISAFLFGFGLIFIITLNKQIASWRTKPGYVDEAEFFSDYAIVNEYRNGDLLITAKIYYAEITKAAETEDYIFIYKEKVAYPVEKIQLSLSELNMIRGIVKLPVPAVAAAGYNSNTNNSDGNGNGGNTPGDIDPFA